MEVEEICHIWRYIDVTVLVLGQREILNTFKRSIVGHIFIKYLITFSHVVVSESLIEELDSKSVLPEYVLPIGHPDKHSGFLDCFCTLSRSHVR
jgi:hypothetical protein